VAQDGKTLDVEHGKLAGLVEGEGVAGEGGDAQAGEDGLLDGFVAAQFQARVKGVIKGLGSNWFCYLAPHSLSNNRGL